MKGWKGSWWVKVGSLQVGLGETPLVGLLGLGKNPPVGLLGLGETPCVGARMMTLNPPSGCADFHGQSLSQAVAILLQNYLICCFGLFCLVLSLGGSAGD